MTSIPETFRNHVFVPRSERAARRGFKKGHLTEHEANALRTFSFLSASPQFVLSPGEAFERIEQVGSLIAPSLPPSPSPAPSISLFTFRACGNVVSRFTQRDCRGRLSQSRSFNFVRRSGAEQVGKRDCGEEVRRHPFWNCTPVLLSRPPLPHSH